MQKSSAGKFHFEPPSPFTSFDHLVCEQQYRVLVSPHPSNMQVNCGAFQHERRTHCDLGAIIAGAVQSFGRISTTNTRVCMYVLFCAVCARFPVSKKYSPALYTVSWPPSANLSSPEITYRIPGPTW